MNKKSLSASLLLIIILGLAVYSNSLKGDFLWDDEGLIKANRFIRSGLYIADIFSNAIGAGNINRGFDAERSHSYRPIQILTYLFDHSVWKLNPLGYHLTNIILHILVALCVYWLVITLFGDNLVALLTGILFAIHPIHTGAVAYISGRADPLAALFTLLSLICYIKLHVRKNGLIYISMLLSYILALFSRESSIMLPFLILLYHLCFKVKLKMKYFIPILSLAACYILLRVVILRSLLPDPLTLLKTWERIPGFFAAIANYVRLLFLPFSLHMEYGDRIFFPADPQAIVGLVISSVLLAYAFKARDRARLISFSIFWFFISLLPSSNIYPIMAYMAEHWLYLPSIGFFIIASYALSRIYRMRMKNAAVIFIALPIIFYASLTVRQNIYWRGPIVFYERTLRYAPESPKLYFNLANRYRDMGEYDKAIELYSKVLGIKADAADVYVNRGSLYSSLGEYEKGIRDFKEAIEINPDFFAAIYNLGLSYYKINNYKESEAALSRLIELDPKYAAAYYNLAVVYHKNGDYESAIKNCDKAIELGYKANPEFLKVLQKHR